MLLLTVDNSYCEVTKRPNRSPSMALTGLAHAEALSQVRSPLSVGPEVEDNLSMCRGP